MDYPVYKSGIEEEKIQQFLKKCGKDTGPVIMEDLVHNQEKLLQFIEEVTDTQGNVMGYVCTNIEEENLSYDYLEDPANQELDQMELIGNGKLWLRKRCTLRARLTVRLSSSLSSSMPMMAMMSCSSL